MLSRLAIINEDFPWVYAQFLWILQTPKFTNHLYSARRPLADLRQSEQSSKMRNINHNLHWNHFGFISLLLLISLDT